MQIKKHHGFVATTRLLPKKVYVGWVERKQNPTKQPKSLGYALL